MNWRVLPMPRLLLPLALGIACADWVSIPAPTLYYLQNLMLLISVLLLGLSALRPSFRDRAWFGLLLFGLCSLWGAIRLSQVQQQVKAPLHFSQVSLEQALGFWGVVREAQPGPRTQRVLLEVKAVQPKGSSWQAAQGILLAYLQPDSSRSLPSTGQHLYLSGQPDLLQGPLNPDAFDFRAYLQRRGVVRQMYVPKDAWRTDHHHSTLPLSVYLRNFCLQVLQKHLPNEATFAVGAALIVGERSHLSADIKQAYSDSGAVHVLSVSGLHVGILALALRWMFGWFSHHKTAQRVSLILELLSIWLFTLVTGAAPATLRAAVMFSLIIGARAFTRSYNIWNLLAASAFGLLCWQPNLLWDIGFQLSYLALAGIVAFQPWIYARLSPAPAWLDYLWKLTSVGLAAQLSTGPLSIFYFHQFPVFFWLSGVIAVPLSGVILVLGLVLFALEALHIPAFWLGKMLAWGIEWLNHSIVFIQALPLAVISGFWWDLAATLGVYVIVAGLGLALYRRRLRWLNYALAFSLIWLLLRWPAIYQAQQQRAIICYHSARVSIVDVVQGRSRYTLSNADLPTERFAAQAHRFHLRLRNAYPSAWATSFRWGAVTLRAGVLQFQNLRIGLVDEHTAQVPVACSTLLLRNNPRIYATDLGPDIRLIVLDGSNNWGTRRWVKRLAADRGIQVHDTAEAGAWVVQL